MSWLLALQASARDDRNERAAIRRYLEPNQKGWFDESMDEIASDPRYLDALMLPPRGSWPRPARIPVTVVEPRSDEVREPPSPSERGETTRNAGQTAYRIIASRADLRLFIGTWLGASAGMMVVMAAGEISESVVSANRMMLALVAACAVAGAIVALSRPRSYRCSDITCRAHVPRDAMACPHCGSSFARTISPREWRDVQEQELDRNVAGMDFDDCADCEPEDPCAVHSVN